MKTQVFSIVIIICCFVSCKMNHNNNVRLCNTLDEDITESKLYPDSIELRYWAEDCSLMFFTGPTVSDLLGYPVSPGYTECLIVKDSLSIHEICNLISYTGKKPIKRIYPPHKLAPYKDMLQDVDFAFLMHYNSHIDTIAGAWNSRTIQDKEYDYEDLNGEIRQWASHQISLHH